MLGSFVVAALLGTTVTPLQVDVGKAKWESLPTLQAFERQVPSVDMIARVEKMLAERQCTIPGQRAERFDITIPYAVLVNPDGRAERVLVAETGCEALETYVGLVVSAMAQKSYIGPTGAAKPRWFASEINFNLQ
jgi:hypothetical protein